MRMVAKRARRSEPDRDALAHSLSNLVQAMSGNLELLAARETDETRRRYLANARAAAQQLEELIRDLRAKDG